jgi:hypothetical protein
MLLSHHLMRSAVARHLISFVSLNRGNEVRQMRLCAVSPLDYPTDAQPSPDVFSSNESSRTMSCLAFTNTAGKSNPGDRVDMDVSHPRDTERVTKGTLASIQFKKCHLGLL